MTKKPIIIDINSFILNATYPKGAQKNNDMIYFMLDAMHHGFEVYVTYFNGAEYYGSQGLLRKQSNFQGELANIINNFIRTTGHEYSDTMNQIIDHVVDLEKIQAMDKPVAAVETTLENANDFARIYPLEEAAMIVSPDEYFPCYFEKADLFIDAATIKGEDSFHSFFDEYQDSIKFGTQAEYAKERAESSLTFMANSMLLEKKDLEEIFYNALHDDPDSDPDVAAFLRGDNEYPIKYLQRGVTSTERTHNLQSYFCNLVRLGNESLSDERGAAIEKDNDSLQEKIRRTEDGNEAIAAMEAAIYKIPKL